MLRGLLILAFVAAASFTVRWCVKAMLAYSCPACHRANGRELVIPLIPGLRWWCPACNGTHRTADLIRFDQEPAGQAPDGPPQL